MNDRKGFYMPEEYPGAQLELTPAQEQWIEKYRAKKEKPAAQPQDYMAQLLSAKENMNIPVPPAEDKDLRNIPINERDLLVDDFLGKDFMHSSGTKYTVATMAAMGMPKELQRKVIDKMLTEAYEKPTD